MWEYILTPYIFLVRGQLYFVMEGFIEVAEYSHDIEWAILFIRVKTHFKTNWPVYCFFVLRMRGFWMARNFHASNNDTKYVFKMVLVVASNLFRFCVIPKLFSHCTFGKAHVDIHYQIGWSHWAIYQGIYYATNCVIL